VALVIVDAIWFVVDRGVVDCGVVEGGVVERAAAARAVVDFADADFAGDGSGALAESAGKEADDGFPLLVEVADDSSPDLIPETLSVKKSRQMGSTLAGSARNCWYFSSTNQSLGPNSGTAADDTVGFRLFSNVKGGQSRLNLASGPWSAGRRGVTHYPPGYYPVHVPSHRSGRRTTVGPSGERIGH
jgi:hypothetical protein